MPADHSSDEETLEDLQMAHKHVRCPTPSATGKTRLRPQPSHHFTSTGVAAIQRTGDKYRWGYGETETVTRRPWERKGTAALENSLAAP